MAKSEKSDTWSAAEDPMGRLFQSYVLSVVGALPKEKEAMIQLMSPKLQEALMTKASDWKAIVAESLHLSQTIDIAIQHAWITTREVHGGDAEKFAASFVQEFYKDGSKVDRWAPGALEAAQERIEEEKIRAKT